MSFFRITRAGSVVATDPYEQAFVRDSAGADTLVVDRGAFLIAQGQGGYGGLLTNTGAWTVDVNGSIVATDGVGLALQAGNPSASKITVGVEGEISGRDVGLHALSSATINNAGVIAAIAPYGAGIELTGGGTHVINNTGTISGAGSIAAGGLGVQKVTNSGVLTGYVDLHDGSDEMSNSGAIRSGVRLGRGEDVLFNSGTITGFVDGDDGADKVTNRGTIAADVYLGEGADVFTNFVTTRGVTDSGFVGGLIDLGTGDDRFYGGARTETLIDTGGSDTVAFGGGNDRYIAVSGSDEDGADVVNGGLGVDTYDASGAAAGVRINLGTIAHSPPFAPGSAEVAANTAIGNDVGDERSDRIYNFENATGGSGVDIIYGTIARNDIAGGAGDDTLCGFGGADRLNGGSGVDYMVGGEGRDVLTGGADADFFIFTALSDSGTTAAARDQITDFKTGPDVIDLRLIDAVSGTAANDAFAFIGTNVAFSGAAGELRAYWTATGQVVEADVNGDGAADFSLALLDPNHGIVLTGGDFLL